MTPKNEKTVAELLRDGAPVNQLINGQTALAFATAHEPKTRDQLAQALGYKSHVQMVLQTGPDPNQMVSGQTPLQATVKALHH
jgi:hypothetical protein